MFGRKKKEPKVEKLVNNASESENQEAEGLEESQQEQVKEMSDDDKLILGIDTSNEDELSESQKKQIEQLGSVKDKISKILKSSNIEIVDENFGDEYDSSSGATSDAKKQQDYDSLKSLYGGADEKKGKELTLTIDDFDYTYTGQYLDEFDMVHLKNIKRIRLQNKYAKKIKKIALIASIVLIVVSGGLAAFFLTRETPVYLKNITLNEDSGSYYVNDYFDYAGLYILAEYSNGHVEKIKLKPSHLQQKFGNVVETAEGGIYFDGVKPAELVFGYRGKTVTYAVTVENKREVDLAAIYSEGLFNLSQGDLINEKNLKLLVKYSNFKPVFVEDYDDDDFDIYIGNEKCEYDHERKGFIASSSTKPLVSGEQSSSVITVVSKVYSDDYDYFSVEIRHVAGEYLVNFD